MWKKFIRQYLTFSRKDRVGVIFLVSLIVLVLGIPLIFPYLRKPVLKDQEISEKINQLNAVMKDSFIPVKHIDYNKIFASKTKEKYDLFYFDPNTISVNDWVRLGVSEKTASTILKYREKGGRFSSPEDLFKIYTLSKEDAVRLVPYVRIRQTERPVRSNNFNNEVEKPKTDFQKPFGKNPVPFDINLSDTNQWRSLPGIGSRLAMRIVNYREKLGGFANIEQVGETRFLPDSTFRKIRMYLNLKTGNVKRLNVNIASFEELNVHPYIGYNLANAIVEYRKQHGDFKGLDNLKQIHLMDDSTFNKIREYLTLQ